jgi:hypothetical protein
VGLHLSVCLSAVYLKTPWHHEQVQLRHVGVGVPQLHCVRTTQNGRCATVSLARLSSLVTAYLYGRMTGMGRYGTTTITIPNVYHNTPLALPTPCRHACTAYLASASLCRLPFTQWVDVVHPHSRPPTALTPCTVSTYAIVAVYCLSCLAPAIPRTIMVFRIQNLNGAQMDQEVWGCYACVQALACRSGRRREQYGMGGGAMEVPARCSGAGSCSEEGMG